jgi:hypothetical protein
LIDLLNLFEWLSILGGDMNKELGLFLTISAVMQASLLPYAPRRAQKRKPTGKKSKSQDEQIQAILAAQAKREKRAAKLMAKQI